MKGCRTCDKYFEDEARTAEITDKTSVAVPADTVNGHDYVQINTYAVSTPAGSESGDVCSYCGKVHPNSLWGRIVAFFHMIFWFFKNLFRG